MSTSTGASRSHCTIRSRPSSVAPLPTARPDRGPSPLAKDLAAVLGVNKNTVLRALHILRDETPRLHQGTRRHSVRLSPTWSGHQSGKGSGGLCWEQGYRRDELMDMIASLP